MMATPSSWAQDVITCDFCDNPTPKFCNICQVSLCVDCVSKHVEKFKSLAHDIVPFTKRKIKLVFPDCEIHPNERCEAHCKKCDVPVCLKCILGSHNGHRYEDMSDIFNKKKKDIEKETQEIDSTIIPQYEEKNEETENKLSIAVTKFDEMDKEKEKHRKFWHQEIDTIFNKLGSLLNAMKENHLAVLKSHQFKIKDRIPDMTQTVQQNKEILKSKNVSAVTKYKSKLGEYRKMPADIDVKLPSLKTKTVQGRELSLELEEYKATLQQISLSGLADDVYKSSIRKLLDRARVIATIPTGVNPLYHVACVGVDEAWVSGEDKTIRRVDIHGSVRDTVTTACKYWPNGIPVTRQGELVYIDGPNRTVNIVRDGRTQTLITTPRGWKPAKLCCTKSGDILVSMFTTDYSQTKVFRYQGHTMKQEIDRNEDGEPIYKGGQYPLYVVENNNGDIVASDVNADTVVVVDKSGRVRFRYDGTPARRKKSFDPRQIVTDSVSQIIVADYNNDCLHILDQNGQFLRCVDNCGLDGPVGLSVDSEGKLWVGSYHSGEVKVIQYMK
ncbi:E3 ubiquitin-protein ligase TRIM71-like [Ostrea edulis]|uniref:E3 ubiquitin-protein ligase TRIM71-like n=1 Tax=Ostrea edulis TaxID=37623 RepID=UPI0024AED308|nr:E3 ubiquitin-protein ligase TRIM71-like [Ostrea edulis]XP_056002567.1 E3 ubiquitin-protein ligase TRIM71-like [Ostrea edulis]